MCNSPDKGQKPPNRGPNPQELAPSAAGRMDPWHHRTTSRMQPPHWWIWVWPHISPESSAWAIQQTMGGLQQTVGLLNQSGGEVCWHSLREGQWVPEMGRGVPNQSSALMVWRKRLWKSIDWF